MPNPLYKNQITYFNGIERAEPFLLYRVAGGHKNSQSKSSNPLTQNTLKICVILCNFVYSKSPKTTLQKRYNDHKFYPSNCEKMYKFWKKCIIKQLEINKEKIIQPLNGSKTPTKSQTQPQNKVHKLHTFPAKNFKSAVNTDQTDITANQNCVKIKKEHYLTFTSIRAMLCSVKLIYAVGTMPINKTINAIAIQTPSSVLESAALSTSNF